MKGVAKVRDWKAMKAAHQCLAAMAGHDEQTRVSLARAARRYVRRAYGLEGEARAANG